jgi:hypothetical protein
MNTGAVIRLALAVLSVYALAACSNVEVPDLRADVEREGIIPADWQPLPLRVGLAPVRVNLELAESRYNVDGSNRWVLTPEAYELNGPDSMHRRLLDVLRDYRMFEHIQDVEGAGSATAAEELPALALRQGLDLVIVPRLVRSDVAYVDSNERYGLNMFVWWMISPVLSWWIADENYEVNLHLEVSLLPVTRAGELAGRRLRPPQPVVRALDDFDEGWHLFAIYNTPSRFRRDNWQRIGARLLPIAEAEAHKAALRYVTGELRELQSQEPFLRGIRRRVALLVGVDGTGRPPVPLTRFAQRDAQLLADQFVEAESQAIPDGALRLLLGPQARRDAVLRAARELSELARGNDDVFFFLSGVGLLNDDSRPALALYSPDGADDALAVEDVVRALTANGPRTLVLMMDCAFTAPGDRRCGTTAEQIQELREAGPVSDLFEPLRALCDERGTELVILAASSPELSGAGGALEIEELGHGLFTAFLLKALTGEADADRNRSVSVRELAAYVGPNVGRVAGLEGDRQSGWFVIPPPRAEFSLPSRRRLQTPATDP